MSNESRHDMGDYPGAYKSAGAGACCQPPGYAPPMGCGPQVNPCPPNPSPTNYPPNWCPPNNYPPNYCPPMAAQPMDCNNMLISVLLPALMSLPALRNTNTTLAKMQAELDKLKANGPLPATTGTGAAATPTVVGPGDYNSLLAFATDMRDKVSKGLGSEQTAFGALANNMMWNLMMQMMMSPGGMGGGNNPMMMLMMMSLFNNGGASLLGG